MDTQNPLLTGNHGDGKRPCNDDEADDTASPAHRTLLPTQTGTKLCLACSTLNIEELLSGGEIQHHASYADLTASSSSGCELCRLIRAKDSAGAADPVDPGPAKILCKAEQDFDHEDYMVALKFTSECGSFEKQIGVCTTEEDVLASRLRYRLIASDSRSQGLFELVSRWLSNCLEHHGGHCIDQASALPTRVLYIGPKDATTDPYLLVEEAKPGRWAALSHCWGSGAPFLTTTSNLVQRQRGIPFADFPATFQDAIVICRRLGIEHLWIDSLCILQDSPSDWLSESARMGYVYSRATVTLVAEASPNCHNGIFAPANGSRTSTIRIPCVDSAGAPHGALYPQDFNDGIGVSGMFKPGPLSSRAWALQEDVLSQRVLRFAEDQLFWACQTSFHSESNPTVFGEFQKVYDPRIFRQGDASRTLLGFWYDMMDHYGTRALTFDKDKFPAVSAMAKEIGALTGHIYRAGIWQEDAGLGLLWSGRGTGQRSPEYIAPSWSWASLRSQKGNLYGEVCGNEETIADILGFDVTNTTDDVYGQVVAASLRLRGPSRSVDPWDPEHARLHWGDVQIARLPRDSEKMHCQLDVQGEQPSHGIICIQVARVMIFGDARSAKPTLAGLLLKPVKQGDGEETYQRIGRAVFRTSDATITEGWERQTVTVI